MGWALEDVFAVIAIGMLVLSLVDRREERTQDKESDRRDPQ